MRFETIAIHAGDRPDRAFGAISAPIYLTSTFPTRLKVFSLAESLVAITSLVEHPATMSHASLPNDSGERVGITDALIRLSVGLEGVDDLIEDLEQALNRL